MVSSHLFLIITNSNFLILGTRKGLVVFTKKQNKNWVYLDTHFLGSPVSLATSDEVTNTFWAMLDHGHWGCKLHRSIDLNSWEEVDAPKYPKDVMITEGG